MWYHLLNCGFPLKVSGETDFPCMSGLRVGQGRVYVRLGDVKAVDFDAWCAGLAAGRSYVSDGFAHALEFTVDGKRPGDRLELAKPGTGRRPGEGRLRRPDAAGGGPRRRRRRPAAGSSSATRSTCTVPRRDGEFTADRRNAPGRAGGQRPCGRQPEVPADDGSTSWTSAFRSNEVAGSLYAIFHRCTPIRSTCWLPADRSVPRRAAPCGVLEAVEQLWRVRGRGIAPAEREEARRAFDRAIERYRGIASETPNGG